MLMRFTTFAGGGSRQSPIKTITSLVLKIAIGIGILVFSVANFENLKGMYLESSRQLNNQITRKDETVEPIAEQTEEVNVEAAPTAQAGTKNTSGQNNQVPNQNKANQARKKPKTF